MKTKRIRVIKKGQTKKRKKYKKTKRVYNKNDYKSGDGMLTSVWGPSLWHYLHTLCLLIIQYLQAMKKKNSIKIL